ncbi:MAG: protein translocase subunit SecF [Candidatus Cloacimonadota bacterium]|nr:MAG: protein translocase subunit SecF [Candidatus Cloacimonadota bacterium]
MIRILKETNFNFIKARKKAFILSLFLIVVGIISLLIRGGLNYGIDFSGGSLIQLHFEKPISTGEIRKALSEAGYTKAQIQKFGTANDFLIKTVAHESFISDTVGPNIIEASIEMEKGATTKSIIIKATASDKRRGNGAISTVEFFVDSLVEEGKGIEMSGVDIFDTPEEKVVATIPVSDWEVNTSHIIYIRAKDSNGNWGKEKKLTVKISGAGLIMPEETPSEKEEKLVSEEQKLETSGTAIKAKLEKFFPDNPLRVDREEMVGPAVSKNLQWKALWVVLLGMGAILLYVSFRFTFRFGVGAVIALFHDVFITIGVLSIMGKEFTIPIVAAILTIVGYSINDTIVISDRIRENLKHLRKEGFGEVINTSINQTLSRTIITSLTTFVAMLVLFLFGGKVIHDFSFALLIGVVIGTYSSVFVVAPIVYEWELKSPTRKRK